MKEHRINGKCAKCGDKWLENVSGHKLRNGLAKGIYFNYKGFYFTESICNRCSGLVQFVKGGS